MIKLVFKIYVLKTELINLSVFDLISFLKRLDFFLKIIGYFYEIFLPRIILRFL